ncbi:hypothetical protein [Vibrio parahaemolyticus]|uniref:hypothetical protein n=1 Tax=Vibrio parahaemolyticus TaxID=670 RepID=UPI000C86C9F5|nr:hypothetical protein [Vibrio parahaemolyticus]PMS43542.1 hypothetical protein C1S89_26560 [Vibrio parahaemolyticus]PMS43787.1 hypothetical protein C1T11_26630 [Vibrio parahaemolyticus]PMS51862.1 hypothetical protein C1T09_26610 [Vibrio parahaemolyticus]PMS80906.1 hypothetical protein C1S90_26955 [Vibrio parahaemolyticus]PMS91124.1 hypothetical protein C1T06_27425 [Vibrio parahaemolyticus]
MNKKINIEQEIRKSLIGIDNPDMPIYRIFPLWFFEELLRVKKLTFVLPRSWEDPYEIIGDAIAVSYVEDGERKQDIINQELPPVFAQCWSATPESDTLLRAYSRVIKDSHSKRNICPKDEGVRVKTTPRKLMHSLLLNTPKTLYGTWFMGAVNYLDRQSLFNYIGNTIRKHGLKVYSNPNYRAKLLLLKREAFSHENELRVLFVQSEIQSTRSLLQVQIEPNMVFDEVSFDPRLDLFERKEREDVVRKLGFLGSINNNDLYQRVLLQISIDKLS